VEAELDSKFLLVDRTQHQDLIAPQHQQQQQQIIGSG